MIISIINKNTYKNEESREICTVDKSSNRSSGSIKLNIDNIQ